MIVQRELLVADTSFFGARDRGANLIWPAEIVGRLRAADLGLSVVTIAEIENGRLKKNWGGRLWAEADRRLANCPRLTIGERTAHVCALIEDAERHCGRTFSENDLWIAATAQTLGADRHL